MLGVRPALALGLQRAFAKLRYLRRDVPDATLRSMRTVSSPVLDPADAGRRSLRARQGLLLALALLLLL